MDGLVKWYGWMEGCGKGEVSPGRDWRVLVAMTEECRVTWGWHWGGTGIWGGIYGFCALDLGGFCGMMLRGHFVDAEFLAVCTHY